MRAALCRIFGHHWKLTISHGEAREYMCARCEERKVIVNGVTLSPEDSAEKSAEMWRYAEGIMYLLDNVEPTYSSGP